MTTLENFYIAVNKWSSDPRIKDFVSCYAKRKPIRENKFFGFFRVSEKGIHGTGKYYRNKLTRERKKKTRRAVRTEKIMENFSKNYDPSIFTETIKKKINAKV